MIRPAALPLFVAVCLFSGAAQAHLQASGNAAVFVDEAGVLDGLAAPAGLVLRDGSDFLWTCDDALDPQPERFHRSASGKVLAANRAGLWTTTDGGCSWELAGDWTFGEAPTDIETDPDLPARIWVTAVGPTSSWLWMSDDDGATWIKHTPAPDDGEWTSVLVLPGGDELWYSVYVPSLGEDYLYRSVNGGAQAEPVAADLTSYGALRVLTAHDGALYAAARLPNSLHTVLVSDDGGAGFTEIGLTAFETVQLVPFADRLWGITLINNTWRTVPGADPELVEDAAASCLSAAAGRLRRCGIPPEPLVLVSDDGESWTAELDFEQVRFRPCAAGTPAADACPAVWNELREAYGFGPVELPDPDPEIACGCTSDTPPGAAAFLLPLTFVAPLRRRGTGA